MATSESSIMFKTTPVVLKASVIPKSDQYDLTQIDPVGRKDEGAIADTKAIAVEPGVQNKSVTTSGFFGFSKRGSDLRGAGTDLGMGIMGDSGMGVSNGSKKHVQESDISDGVAPRITPTCAGLDPVGRPDSHSDQSDIGIVMGIESNQPQHGFPAGGVQPNHSEQVRGISGVRKGEREPINTGIICFQLLSDPIPRWISTLLLV